MAENLTQTTTTEENVKEGKTSLKDKINPTALMWGWFGLGIIMVIIGAVAICKADQAISAISTLLGVISLVIAILIFTVRILGHMAYHTGKIIKPDGIIWFILAFLLFNTDLLMRIGTAVFTVAGAVVILTGVKAFCDALKNKDDKFWFVPKLIVSILLVALGIYGVIKADILFTNMTVIIFGIFFIIHGITLLIDWAGQIKYNRNFKGVEKD